MERLEPRDTSLWLATAPTTMYPTLEGERRADVVVVGGGVAGMSTAFQLAGEGHRVIVLEADRIGRGATGRATVKVTAAQGLKGQQIADARNEDTALAYLAANRAGLERVAHWVRDLRLDCGFRRSDHVLYAEHPERAPALRRELDLLRRSGIPAAWAAEVDLPYRVSAAVTVHDQAVFHPVRFVQALAQAAIAHGARIYERAAARSVDLDQGVVETTSGAVRATHVVLATHASIDDRDLLAARLEPTQEYAIAGRPPAVPSAMYLSVDDPKISLRVVQDGDGPILVVVGEAHRVGEGGDTHRRYASLARWARERFGLADSSYRWTAHDLASIDGLPMIGQVSRSNGRGWVATGFDGWGMTNGALAAHLISEQIGGRMPADAHLFTPSRWDVLRHPGRFLASNAVVLAHWALDRRTEDPSVIEDLEIGETAIVRIDDEPIAVHRDDGGLHAVSAVCTHLGCIVEWNPAARSWDCPCHGSRFGVDGAVIEPPATQPLVSMDDRLDGRASGQS